MWPRDSKECSEGIHKLIGEQPGFLREVLRTRQVAGLAGFPGLRDKTANFFEQILLRGAQLLSFGLLKILLRHGNVFVGSALEVGLLTGRKLR